MGYIVLLQMAENSSAAAPSIATEAVMVHTSGQLPVDPVVVKGYDFNNGVDYNQLFDSFKISGFQATNFGNAVDEINKMVSREKERDKKVRKKQPIKG